MSNISYKGGKDLDAVIDEAIRETNAAVLFASKDAAKTAADSTAKLLKSTSPKQSGKYARGWKVKAQDGGYVVYNDKHYRLTHLLENGHDVIVNGKKVGRAKAYPHIKPAEQEGIKDFEQEVRKQIERRLGT